MNQSTPHLRTAEEVSPASGQSSFVPPPTPQRSGVVSLKPGVVSPFVSLPTTKSFTWKQHPFCNTESKQIIPKWHFILLIFPTWFFLFKWNFLVMFFWFDFLWCFFGTKKWLLFQPHRGALALHAIDLPRHVAVPALGSPVILLVVQKSC